MIDLDRLRELAREPERMAMQRTGQMPTMTSEVLRQKQEIGALRRGLLDAISEIERFQERDQDARWEALERDQ